MKRPDFFTLKNGKKVKLPFTEQEYKTRLENLRIVMSNNNFDMIIARYLPAPSRPRPCPEGKAQLSPPWCVSD